MRLAEISQQPATKQPGWRSPPIVAIVTNQPNNLVGHPPLYALATLSNRVYTVKAKHDQAYIIAWTWNIRSPQKSSIVPDNTDKSSNAKQRTQFLGTNTTKNIHGET